jgi:hypothetical protein
MLIALMTILFLGGGAAPGFLEYIADSRDQVKDVMEEGEQRDQALDTLKSMKDRAKEFSKLGKHTAKNLGELLESGEASEQEINATWSAHFDNYDRFNNDMMDLRFELKKSVSRDEWAQVFSKE